MENSRSSLMSRRELSSVSHHSPCIVRSKSVTTTRQTLTPTNPESNISSRRYSSRSQRFTVHDHSDRRSKSTTKARPNTKHGDENAIATAFTINKKKQQENKESTVFWNKWRNDSDHPEYYSVMATRKATSVTMSPSAWALSPGRSLFGSPARSSDQSSQVKQSKNGGVNRVMKYLKQMKLSSSVEEKKHHHQLKLLHNRLLQWRFVNARAAAAMESVEKVAELKVFGVWLNILVLRKNIVKKKIDLEKLKHGIKLYKIIIPQVFLLNDWTKIERRNQESVGRLKRILATLSIRLPLIHGAKANLASLHQAMNNAMQVMDKIELLVTELYNRQVQKNVDHLAQLIATYQKEEQCIIQLQKMSSQISTLFNREKSAVIHVMQAESEIKKPLNIDICIY